MDKPTHVLSDRPGCPFALPAVTDISSAAFYCRLPGGRVRLPTPDERVRFCVSGRYEDCPTVQRYIRRN